MLTCSQPGPGCSYKLLLFYNERTHMITHARFKWRAANSNRYSSTSFRDGTVFEVDALFCVAQGLGEACVHYKTDAESADNYLEFELLDGWNA